MYLAPVAVWTKAQNGSVPRAKNGVSVAIRGGGVTIPVATIGGITAPELTGTRGVLGVWKGRVQLVMMIMRADIPIGRRDRIRGKVMKILSYYMRMESEVKSKIKT
jgi:hypothetical protein